MVKGENKKDVDKDEKSKEEKRKIGKKEEINGKERNMKMYKERWE
jgi:hypothetical protein